MHFVAETAGKKIVRHHRELFSQSTGEKIGTQGTIWLNLERGTAPDWAVEEALRRFKFAMRPAPGSIGGADIPVEQWCVYVDTVQWQQAGNHPDEVREACELVLLSDPDMMLVEPPKARPPWPNYDELTIAGSRTAEKVAARNLETAAEIGVGIEELIAYEVATLDREPVLALYEKALEDLREPTAAEPIVVEA